MPALRLCFAVLLVFGLSPLAHADALSDLRATLETLQPHAGLSAKVELKRTTHPKDADKPRTGHARLHLSVGDDGLQVSYPQAIMQRMQDELAANTKDADKPTPTTSLVRGIDPVTLQQMVDFAPHLLRTLHDGTLESVKQGTYAGQSVQVLTIKLPVNLSGPNSDAVKKMSATLVAWVGADGVPLALNFDQQYEGSKFFISFSGGNTVKYSLRKIGTRLVATSRASQSHFSGFGQDNKDSKQIILQPQVTARIDASAAAASADADSGAPASASSVADTPATNS